MASFRVTGMDFAREPLRAQEWQDQQPGRMRMDSEHSVKSRLHVLYSGRVQGVGFRYTVKTVALGFEVTGAVRNLPDGRVELSAEGTKEELEAFQQAIRESGLGSLIAREDFSWSEAKNEFRGFVIAG
jgi:acylphosphatase